MDCDIAKPSELWQIDDDGSWETLLMENDDAEQLHEDDEKEPLSRADKSEKVEKAEPADLAVPKRLPTNVFPPQMASFAPLRDVQHLNPAVVRIPRPVLQLPEGVRCEKISPEFLKLVCEAISNFTPEDYNWLYELKQFVNHFKSTRMRRGLAQREVGRLLGHFTLRQISQTTISRFEEVAMPFTNVIKLRPEMHIFVDLSDEQIDSTTTISPLNPRRRRYKISDEHVAHLESLFREQPQRSKTALEEISDSLGLPLRVVRNWFHNRKSRGTPASLKQLHGEDPVTPVINE
ncbi:hypothetical protein L596_009194 [Steinernema carpocapsae]|uniref:Homeobox domain-containing protein n=1 Tax=Steinernema carpocapsae TaxID=34508 RepID=A0A4U5PEM9_STECR|nr:hypothetical protein L596_009194 [Steinernema carpocapsae]